MMQPCPLYLHVVSLVAHLQAGAGNASYSVLYALLPGSGVAYAFAHRRQVRNQRDGTCRRIRQGCGISLVPQCCRSREAAAQPKR